MVGVDNSARSERALFLSDIIMAGQHRMSLLGLVALVLVSSPQMARSEHPEGIDCSVKEENGRKNVIPSSCPTKCKLDETSGELVSDVGDANDGGYCNTGNEHCTPELCWPGTTYKEQCMKKNKDGWLCKRCHEKNKEAFWCDKYLVGGGETEGSHKGCGKMGGKTKTDECYKMLSDTYYKYRKPKEGDDEEDKQHFAEACAAMLKVKECYASTKCKSVGAAFAETRTFPGARAGWSKCAGLETFECEAQYMDRGQFTNKDCFVEDGVIKTKAKKMEETKKDTKKKGDDDKEKGGDDKDTKKKGDDSSKEKDKPKATDVDTMSAASRCVYSLFLPLVMLVLSAFQ